MTSRPDQVPERLLAKASWLVKEVAVYAGRLSHEGFAAAGARPYWYPLLAALDEFGPSSQADLGRRCGIDRSDVVAAVSAMADAEYVRRTEDRVDRRRNVITLTTAGERELRALDGHLAAVQEALLEPLDGAEREQLVRLLQRVRAHQRDRVS
ncbi:MarR family winged helix-turn-helix transcriptional regulator [Streptomyces sp. NPDC051940]|uniref:MarR family winged helix-turn-helix transcriptional regulator n=1 Tax=Streptomyces sp. NPDC051940 TaxID=3155675 RepID=UPI00341B751F